MCPHSQNFTTAHCDFSAAFKNNFKTCSEMFLFLPSFKIQVGAYSKEAES